ncbi:unnamed protein product [Blepharisma stoltei]|uniref:FHA domain-containing protein n=1 Tax=Blepharisma stoltei TaxID=1481888 RepID=A0AAU9JXZ8_9CILI|nr:unnamed protein product [Blepharisma stoltei]
MGNYTAMRTCCGNSLCAPQFEIYVSDRENLPAQNPETALTKRNKNDLQEAEPLKEQMSAIRESIMLDSQYRDTSFDRSRIQKLESAMHYAKLLRLKVLSSATLPKNLVISINALGHENSLRDVKDGITYFGCKKRAKSQGIGKGPVINDFVIPSQDKYLAEKHRGQHFQIYYDLIKDAYYVKDLGVGFGTFLRLASQLILKENYLLHMGDNFILVNLVASPDHNSPRLRLKLFGAPCSGDVFYFNASDYNESVIRIGRTTKCEIQIEDSLISKVQCTIYYSLEGWILVDGDLENDRTSTNGTWLYLNENHELSNGMMFKSNHTLFQVSIV